MHTDWQQQKCKLHSDLMRYFTYTEWKPLSHLWEQVWYPLILLARQAYFKMAFMQIVLTLNNLNFYLNKDFQPYIFAENSLRIILPLVLVPVWPLLPVVFSERQQHAQSLMRSNSLAGKPILLQILCKSPCTYSGSLSCCASGQNNSCSFFLTRRSRPIL